MHRLYKWWANEKEIKLLHVRLKRRIEMCAEMEDEIRKLKKENQRMREIIVSVSDEKIKNFGGEE